MMRIQHANVYEACEFFSTQTQPLLVNLEIKYPQDQTNPLVRQIKPQIWVLEWCPFKKPKVFTSLNGEQLRTPKSTEG